MNTTDRQKHDTEGWHRFFDQFNVFTNSIRLEIFIKSIQKRFPAGSRILEIGFGSGATAKILADMGYRVTAIDIDSQVVQRFEATLGYWKERLEVVQMDMFDLKFKEGEFDLAFHQGVLEHFPDQDIVRALQQQARVAKNVIFDVPNNRDRIQHYGDERFLTFRHWASLIKKAELELLTYFGRSPRVWTYILPHGFFLNKNSITSMLGRRFGRSFIFICASRPSR